MIEQGTQDWHLQRLGKVTASRISDVMAKGRSANTPSATRSNYMAELVAARLTGDVPESYSNAAMQWGTETEPKARLAYELVTGVDVEQIGFVDHPTIAMSGASPDGLVGNTGLVEIKCPNTATHIATLLGSEIDRKYILQMQWQMECTGRKWCDFVSYDPRMPPEMQLKITRVDRDPEAISNIAKAVLSFQEELGDLYVRLVWQYRKQDAA